LLWFRLAGRARPRCRFPLSSQAQLASQTPRAINEAPSAPRRSSYRCRVGRGGETCHAFLGLLPCADGVLLSVVAPRLGRVFSSDVKFALHFHMTWCTLRTGKLSPATVLNNLLNNRC